MEPIFDQDTGSALSNCFILRTVSTIEPDGSYSRWYLDERNDTTTTGPGVTAFGLTPPIWYNVRYDPGSGHVYSTTQHNKGNILTMFSHHPFPGFVDPSVYQNLMKAPATLNIRCAPPVGMYIAHDGASYTWQQILDYLWTSMVLELFDYNLLISVQEGNWFRISYSTFVNTFEIRYR